MVDGFHWTRVTSKQLRFLYEEIVQSPLPDAMREQAASAERRLSGRKDDPQADPSASATRRRSPLSQE